MADGETAGSSNGGGTKGVEAGKPTLGRRVLRGVLILLGIVATLVVTAVVLVYIASEKRFRQHFDRPIASVVFPLPTDAAAVARGERVAATRGCLECHGAGGKGQLFLDQMPVMQLRPSNISPGGPTAHYSNEDWARAVRNCVRPDGSAILFMPCQDFSATDDVDLGLIVAYLRSLPASNNDPGKTTIGPLGRALFLADQLPLVAAERIPARESVPPAPPVGRTAAYGEYLAHACTGCHGDHSLGRTDPRRAARMAGCRESHAARRLCILAVFRGRFHDRAS